MNETIRQGENKVVWEIIRAKSGQREIIEEANLRTNDGTNWQAEQMANSPTTIIRRIALTGDTTTPASSMTNLVGEFASNGLSRKTATYAHTTDASRYTLSASFQYTSSSRTTVACAALCTALTDTNDSADTHFCITALSAVQGLEQNDTITINWGISF